MRLIPVFLATVFLTSLASAAEQRVSSPSGKLTLVVSDEAGLHYRVEIDGKPLLAHSSVSHSSTADPAAPETVVETTRDFGDTRTLILRLAPGGGYVATLSRK